MKLGWLEATVLTAATVANAKVCHMSFGVYLAIAERSIFNSIEANCTLLQDLAFSPPYYPSPWATGEGEWAEAYSRAVEFVSTLTLAEKVNLTTGAGYVIDDYETRR
jgi:beta-glucosidase